jgi:protein-tyrosine-phosphatase
MAEPRGGAGPRRIIFLCRDHAVLSPMAEALARQMLGDSVTVASGALAPEPLHPLTVDVLKEINLVAKGAGKGPAHPIEAADLVNFDLVVVMGGKSALPPLPPRVLHLHWPIVDPREPPVEPGELKRRFLDTRVALSKHLKQLARQQLGHTS